MQSSDEGLDVRAPDMAVGVALGLHVYDIEPEGVEPDQPVEAAIAPGAKVFGVGLQAAVAHLDQELEHELLQKHGRLLRDTTQQVRRYSCVRGIDDPGDGVTGREVVMRAIRLARPTLALSGASAEFLILRELT